MVTKFRAACDRFANDYRRAANVSTLRRYRALCHWAPGVYALLGLLALPTQKHEILPFFCWFLFPVVQTRVERYGVELLQFDGSAIVPVWVERSALLGNDRTSMDLQVLIAALGAAVANNDTSRATELRRRLEANFLRLPCAYRLKLRRYDVLERFRGAAEPPSAHLASFTCGQFED